MGIYSNSKANLDNLRHAFSNWLSFWDGEEEGLFSSLPKTSQVQGKAKIYFLPFLEAITLDLEYFILWCLLTHKQEMHPTVLQLLFEYYDSATVPMSVHCNYLWDNNGRRA